MTRSLRTITLFLTLTAVGVLAYHATFLILVIGALE